MLGENSLESLVGDPESAAGLPPGDAKLKEGTDPLGELRVALI